MKLGIMQPYFFPYIGYWQLINSVDVFVVYDNIEFTKNSWIRRNRILLEGRDKLFTLPLKKDSDYLDVRERYLAENFPEKREKIISQINNAYSKAPQFYNVFSLIKECVELNQNNLFEYIYYSIIRVMKYLNIETEIIISSNININHSLQGKHKVMEICKFLGSDVYINPIGGVNLYDKSEFASKEIQLKFLQTEEFEYEQFGNPFVPNLSIIDVMMFNNKIAVKDLLDKYRMI
ncbi:MAG: WbqC family protein [Dysgonamonadaceae bacterium]|nr:WbqC family protein [Dysgonamonadaceae bacterium]